MMFFDVTINFHLVRCITQDKITPCTLHFATETISLLDLNSHLRTAAASSFPIRGSNKDCVWFYILQEAAQPSV